MAKARKGQDGIGHVTLSLEDMPEVLAGLRREMSALLRAEAGRRWVESERNVIDQSVCQALRAVADAFEAGLLRTDELS